MASFTLAGVVGSAARGEPAGALWFVGAGAAAYLSFQLGLRAQRWRPTLLTLLVVGYAAVLAALVLARAVGESEGALGPIARVAGVFSNPNAAGSALAVSLGAALSLSWRWGGLVALAAVPALLLTGSRTALFAALASLLVVAVGALWKGRQRPIIAALPALSGVAVCALGVMIWLHGSAEPGRNLLLASENLLDESWKWSHAAWAEVTPMVVGDAPAGARGMYVRARADVAGRYPRLLVSNNVTLGRRGTTYVASAYFRAEGPVTIVLGSNYTTTNCQVSLEWSRCQTPPAEGNGTNYVQFKLSVTQPGAAVAFQIHSPQVEEGDAASAPQASWRAPVRTLLDEVVIPRLTPTAWLADKNVAARLAAYRVAWGNFRGNPLLGVGRGRFASADRVPDAPPTLGRAVNHAHDLFLQVAAEEGALGLLGLLALLCLTGAALGSNWRRALPLFAATFVVNLTDVAFFRAGGYYVYWVALGALSACRAHASHRISKALSAVRPPRQRPSV